MFSDMVLTIPVESLDLRKLKILQSYKPLHNGSNYTLMGTYDEFAKLDDSLRSGSFSGRWTTEIDESASAKVQPVAASTNVMEYIKQKCGDKLQKIQGDSVVIETLPDHRAGQDKLSSTVYLTFRPVHGSRVKKFRCDCARKQFITFYQRIASDLQELSIALSPSHQKTLPQRFPHLLFKYRSYKQEAIVIGPFNHVAQLREFISQEANSMNKRAQRQHPQASPSSTTLHSPPNRQDPEDEMCPICMDKIKSKKKQVLKCKHSFCEDCLKMAFQYKPVCPTCGTLYGVLKGTQPEGGTMNINHISTGLPGYEKYKTIVIQYDIPNGTQKEDHPNPGQAYTGVSRQAFLPDTSEGRAVLRLLQRAFDQRLIFTIGRSSTSGRNNVVTWNDIHHKTSIRGGPTNYGYPDPDYLSRVRDELKVKGIE